MKCRNAAQLVPTLQAQLATNDVNVRWFDAATSFIWPEVGGWLAVPADLQPDDALLAFWPETAVLTDSNQQLYHLPSPPDLAWSDPVREQGAVVTFLGYRPILIEKGAVSVLPAWLLN